MRRAPIAALFAALLLAAPAHADAVEDALAAALEAYRAGEYDRAKEEAEFAASLMGQQKAKDMSAFLPPAFAGWTREDGEAQAMGMIMFGGGLSASATYTRDGETVEAQFLADNPMVSTMGAMLATPSMMATIGEVRRIGGRRYVAGNDGDVMMLLDDRILIQIGGTAPLADKIAYFEAIDFDALAAF